MSNILASLQRVIKNYHFWLIVVLFAIAIVLHYPQQILHTDSTSLFSYLGLTRHAVERILLLLPVTYAGFFLGTRAGLISLAVALAVMLPRDVFISEYLPDALLETGIITLIGGLVNILFRLHRSDIAKIRSASDALKESDKMLSLISEASADIIMILDIDFKMRFISHAEQGFTKDKLLGKHVYAYVSKEQQEMVKGYLEKVIETQSPVYYESEYKRPDGNIVNYETIASPIITDDKVIGFIATSRDITKRKKTDEALYESEQKYRSLVGNVRLGVFRSTSGLNGVFLEVNPAMQEITGYTREELLQMRVCDLYANPDEREQVLEDIILQKGALTKELRFRKKDGTHIIVSDTKAVVRDSEGEILYFDGILEDITERKKTDEALKLAYTEIEQIFKTTACGICVIDTDFNILQCNKAFSNLSELPRDKIFGNKCYDIFNHQLCNTAKCALRRIINGEDRIEIEFMKKTAKGDKIYLALTATPYKQPDGKLLGMIESFNDITQRKKAEENLHYYLQEITRAQEEERKRISRELHDSTTQNLIALLRQLENFLNEKADLPQKDTETLWGYYRQVKDILQDLRRFSRDLRPSVLDELGLIPALEWVTAGLITEYELDVNLKVTGKSKRLSRESELLLFRIIQEALRNTARHAQASKADIKVKFHESKVTVTLSDDGIGFRLPDQLGDLPRTGKLGLAGMQERAKLLGGSLKIKSEIGKGTTVFIEVPI